MIASSSARTTRTGVLTDCLFAPVRLPGRQLGRHAIEQGVLFPLQIADRSPQRVPLPCECVGVPPHLACLGLGERRFGYERAQARVLGLVLEERELLVDDRALGAQPLQTVADVDQTPLEEGPSHGRGSLRSGGSPVCGHWRASRTLLYPP